MLDDTFHICITGTNAMCFLLELLDVLDNLSLSLRSLESSK